MTIDVRELYRNHEHLVDGATERLLPAVTARRRQRKIKNRIGYASIALVVAATIAGVVAFVPRDSTVRPPVTVPRPAVSQTVPTGTRFESSLGLQIAVPTTWQTNDWGCPEDERPTVVRAWDAVDLCLGVKLVTKEFAIIRQASTYQGTEGVATDIDADVSRVVSRTVRLNGVAVTRAAGPIGGGRFAGWIVAKSRDVEVIVRTNSEAQLTAILDSARLVTIDHNGCASVEPAPVRPSPPPAGTPAGTPFVDPAPAAISVCFYGNILGNGRLQASSRRTGPEAVALASALNATAIGTNRGYPKDCEPSSGPQMPDAVLLIQRADGTTQVVNATFQSCVGVHLDNGRQYRKLTVDLVAQIMAGMHAGYGYNRSLLDQ